MPALFVAWTAINQAEPHITSPLAAVSASALASIVLDFRTPSDGAAESTDDDQDSHVASSPDGSADSGNSRFWSGAVRSDHGGRALVAAGLRCGRQEEPIGVIQNDRDRACIGPRAVVGAAELGPLRGASSLLERHK